MCNQPVKVDTLKLYFFLLSNWEKKNAVTYFLLQIVKKKKKKNAYFTSLCFVHYWLCWYVNYFPYIDFLLKWESTRCSEVDGRNLNVYKVVCWYPFRETSVFKLHLPRGGKLAHTADWMLMVPGAWVTTLYSDSVNLGLPEARGPHAGTVCLSSMWPLRSSRCCVWSIYSLI